ncbi:hypothetical protein HMPREF0078_1450 [Anaerococcus vaginalis ATCC 51170]|uniref:Uncharacterized protein n=1 Tax=Anaerococcus vaginalis ATCC 51170 TaxID=655811 RepID=C7HW52_9FIRM|nr:hypothetical protein HMPREF0078_1450 [Anaerococcus vaginalis ATCC 51170]
MPNKCLMWDLFDLKFFYKLRVFTRKNNLNKKASTPAEDCAISYY